MLQQSIVTTGFSSGLGADGKKYMEENFPHWHHIMICRNPNSITPAANLTILKADLLSIESVLSVCSEIKSLLEQGNVPPIKYVLANAGAVFKGRTKNSVDGFEATFHVNVIANYYLIKELLPVLEKDDPRVFVTGSRAHYGDIEHTNGMVPAPFWDDKNLDVVMRPVQNGGDANPTSAKAGFRAYATSKLAVLYLVHRFAKENPLVKFLVYDPGCVPTGTGLGREANWFLKCLVKIATVYFRVLGIAITSEAAGKKMIDCMFDDKLFEQVKNLVYCEQGEIMDSSAASYNVEREQQLWEALQEIR